MLASSIDLSLTVCEGNGSQSWDVAYRAIPILCSEDHVPVEQGRPGARGSLMVRMSGYGLTGLTSKATLESAFELALGYLGCLDGFAARLALRDSIYDIEMSDAARERSLSPRSKRERVARHDAEMGKAMDKRESEEDEMVEREMKAREMRGRERADREARKARMAREARILLEMQREEEEREMRDRGRIGEMEERERMREMKEREREIEERRKRDGKRDEDLPGGGTDIPRRF